MSAQYDNITVDEYVNLTAGQKKLVKKDKVQSLLDDQARNLNNESLKKLITDTITLSIEAIKKELKEELQAEIKELREKVDKADDETKILKKVIVEQQKFLEGAKREKMQSKVFMSGIPEELSIDEEDPVTGAGIIPRILSFVEPNINDGDYKVVRTFPAKEGFTRHCCLLEFKDRKVKEELLKKSKTLKDLAEEHVLKKVYIKSDQTPLTRKENSRIYNEFKKLLETHKEDINHSFSIFLSKFEELLDKYAPLKKISQKEYKQRFKPWITDKILDK